jgi:hypothetical protein
MAANSEDIVLIEFDAKIRDLNDRMRIKDTLINFLEQDQEHNYSREEKDQMLSEARKDLELLGENKNAMLALKNDYAVAKANADAGRGCGRRGRGGRGEVTEAWSWCVGT